MLIKSADDKSKRLKLLNDLQASPRLSADQKAWLNEELWRVQTGIQGEKDAAYYIDADYADNENFAVLHDLRISVDGEVAQIDHLLIGRALVFLLETKNFNGNVSINEHGEFTVTYASGKRIGIASPLEQSRRHEKVLRKLFEQLGIQARTGGALECQHVVLFHPKAVIQRPDKRAFDTDNVIKADALRSWHDRFVDTKVGVLKTLALGLNIRSSATVREWAEKVARQHRPQDLLELPPFMAPRAPEVGQPAVSPNASAANAAGVQAEAPPRCATCGTSLDKDVVHYCQKHAHRFGSQLYCRAHQQAFAPAKPAASMAPRALRVQPVDTSPKAPTVIVAGSPVEAPLTCATCGLSLDDDVVHYCQKHARRFAGQLYCREHQQAFGAKPAPPMPEPARRAVAQPPQAPPSDETPVCAVCGVALSERVVGFCRANPARFSGRLYCMAHQRR